MLISGRVGSRFTDCRWRLPCAQFGNPMSSRLFMAETLSYAKLPPERLQSLERYSKPMLPALSDNEKDSIGSAPAEEWRGATDGGAGALRIEFIERSRNQSLGIEWFFAADRAEWST
jgi:hypothetical protein